MPKFVERSENAVTTRTRRLQIALIRDGIGEISSNIYVCMYIYISPDFTIVTVLVDRSHTLPRYERFVQCYRVDEGGDKNR